MRYVLDTNALSLLMAGHSRALDRLQAAGRTEVSIPQPVLAEVLFGLERLPHSKKRLRLNERLHMLRTVLAESQWTPAVSESFAHIKAFLERKGEMIEDFDIAIAAHALAEGATLVTANLKHMRRIPRLLLDDWSS